MATPIIPLDTDPHSVDPALLPAFARMLQHALDRERLLGTLAYAYYDAQCAQRAHQAIHALDPDIAAIFAERLAISMAITGQLEGGAHRGH
jgi:hypothetical protein